MLNPSLAPVRRAATFFGCMALAVAALSVGPAFQPVTDLSSETVAQARGGTSAGTEIRSAAVDPTQRIADRAKRAIATSQEARLSGDGRTVIR